MAAKIGFHVSIAGGISNSVDNAKKNGCSAFQIFSRNPRGWAAKPLDPLDVQLFKMKLSSGNFQPGSVVVHMPYLPNLSGPPGEFYDKSALTLSQELQRCSALGIQYLVIHLGSHMGKGSAQGLAQLTKAIEKALSLAGKQSKESRAMVLLENNAGQKNSVGASFEELRIILDRLSGYKDLTGVCLDTCHLFASGHDIRTKGGVDSTIAQFEGIVGLASLNVIHLNDSKGKLGSNLDRHEHIGLGEIGLEGLGAFLNNKSTKDLPIIMETPIDEQRGDRENMKVIQDLLEEGS